MRPGRPTDAPRIAAVHRALNLAMTWDGALHPIVRYFGPCGGDVADARIAVTALAHVRGAWAVLDLGAINGRPH